MRQPGELYKRAESGEPLKYKWGCYLCGRTEGNLGPLCDGCVRDMALAVGRSKRDREIKAIDGVWIPFAYVYPLDGLIRAAKLDGNLAANAAIGYLFALAAARESLQRPDIIIPVPLHWGRIARRGFNQSGLLAEAIGKMFKVEVRTDLASRSRRTKAQMNLGEEARKRNVEAVFTASDQFIGATVVIVDDVVTTGATVGNLASAIRETGCKKIKLWALATA